ncbi:MAG: DUF2971 domain-containing protein [Clostridiaceae bacterium]|nr:DUF2971 domain-containing protein [Clostridiaceae bacterium]
MNSADNLSIEKMKEDISKAGNLFYQYRPCRRDAAIIYDIENIRHGVVYARTPLQMNDPFDSKIGFSVEKVYEECIDLAIDQVDPTLDLNLKMVIKNLLKYRIVGETLDFFNALNKLKNYIFIQSAIAKVPLHKLPQFITRDLNRLYNKCPSEVKKYLNKDAFFVFSLLIKDYQNIDIEEKTIVEAFNMEECLKELEKVVVKIRGEIYLPSLTDFLSKITVTCFSASGWDNQLMWSHYANSYSGICVEYDFGKMDKFIGFMYPVNYSSVRPTISLKDLGLTELKKDEKDELITEKVNINAIFSYLLAKNKCWSYEEEWRIINVEGEPYTPIFVEAPFVKSITLGLDLDDICKQLLWDVCEERGIECYQLIINPGDYSLTRELLTDEDFVFDKEKEERYINFICEHMVPITEKISVNCISLTKAINEGNFEPSSMMNVLTLTLDYLSDVYFLKRTFNRFCHCTNTPISEVTGDTQIGIATNQIDSFIIQSEAGVKTIEASLIDLMIMNKIIINDSIMARKLITEIKEMFAKHHELKWYGKEGDDE